MARARVAPEVFVAAYEAAKQVLERRARLTNAQRTEGLRFMLNRIAEGGPGDLMIALQSVMNHVTYLQDLSGSELGLRPVYASLRRVHAEFVGRLRETAAFDEASLSLDEQVTKALADTAEARVRRLQQAPPMPEQQIVLARIFRRNPDVIAEVLSRANGVCQGCTEAAPFLRADGRPYLEVHHRQPLAAGGADTVENAIALCPNCHRERHYGASYRDTQR